MNVKTGYNMDLTAIEPRLRGIVRRRLEAISRFEASPGRQNAERLAKEIGLGTAQFYNLVKAWRTLRDPRKLAGPEMARTKPVDLDEAQRRIIERAIDHAPTAAPDEIVRLAIGDGDVHGVPMPAKEKVRRAVLARRPSRLTDELASLGDLIVDHTVLDLPVDFGGGTIERPLATVVVHAPAHRIVALEIGRGGPSTRSIAASLRAAFECAGKHGGEPVIERLAIPSPSDEDWPRLHDAVGRAGLSLNALRSGPYGHGRCIEALLGQRREGIRFRPRLVEAGPERRSILPHTSHAPLDAERTRELVLARLEVGDVPGFSCDLTEPSMQRLLERLGSLSGDQAS